jgi:hypothetical protein
MEIALYRALGWIALSATPGLGARFSHLPFAMHARISGQR